jgi:hypothetical protein
MAATLTEINDFKVTVMAKQVEICNILTNILSIGGRFDNEVYLIKLQGINEYCNIIIDYLSESDYENDNFFTLVEFQDIIEHFNDLCNTDYWFPISVVEVIPTVFYNTVQSGNFTRNNCGGGYYGSLVTYTVPAGTYMSSVSQADADSQALTEITANGQTYANTYGTCTIIPTVLFESDFATPWVGGLPVSWSRHVGFPDIGTITEDPTDHVKMSYTGNVYTNNHIVYAGAISNTPRNVRIEVKIDSMSADTDILIGFIQSMTLPYGGGYRTIQPFPTIAGTYSQVIWTNGYTDIAIITRKTISGPRTIEAVIEYVKIYPV